MVALAPRGRNNATRLFTLLTALIGLGLALLVAAAYNWGDTGSVQFASSVPWIQPFGLHFGFAIIDSVSLWLVLLTAFLMPLVVLGSWSAVTDRVQEFHAWMLFLQAAMIGTFVATDLIFFYICFEFTLIPLFFLIGIFGSAQRLKAAKVFFLYTFTGSMLTFAGVLYLAWTYATAHGGHWSFAIADLIAQAHHLSRVQQTWILLALLAGFAVKVPLWPVHTWLPLAHTEAPTAGSVILAGVLLKLGTYGLYRLAIPMAPDVIVAAAPYIAAFAIVGILYTALVCWVQKDLKKLIAYSSVSHLGFCVLGLFALNVIGGTGSVMYMVNHGLSTGALFLCVGMIYERFHTREMAEMSGLARAMPIWAFFFVFFCLASVGLPGLNGFVSEFLCLMGTFDWRTGVLGPGYAAIACLGMVVGAIYILYMVGRVVFGPLKVPAAHGQGSSTEGHTHGPLVHDLSAREIIVLLPLAAACLFIGLYPSPMLDSLNAPIAALHPRIAARQAHSNLHKEAQVSPESGLAIATAAPRSRLAEHAALATDLGATRLSLTLAEVKAHP